jgi:hypothetical protein
MALNQGVENLFLASMGQRGSRWLNSTGTTVTGNYKVVHCLGNTEFVSLDDSLRSTDSDSIAGLIVPSGALLGGKFTKIRLKSGKVILYI